MIRFVGSNTEEEEALIVQEEPYINFKKQLSLKLEVFITLLWLVAEKCQTSIAAALKIRAHINDESRLTVRESKFSPESLKKFSRRGKIGQNVTSTSKCGNKKKVAREAISDCPTVSLMFRLKYNNSKRVS